MQFTLTMDLPKDACADDVYRALVRSFHANVPLTTVLEPGTFAVEDGNGKTLGRWAVSDDSYPSTLQALTAMLAGEIRLMSAQWAEGRATSPSEMDWVRAGDELLNRWAANYPGSTEEGREFLADEIFEDAGTTYVTAEDLAAHIMEVLTAE